MKKQIVAKKTLVLARETIRQLSNVKLRHAVGAGVGAVEPGSWINCPSLQSGVNGIGCNQNLDEV